MNVIFFHFRKTLLSGRVLCFTVLSQHLLTKIWKYVNLVCWKIILCVLFLFHSLLVHEEIAKFCHLFTFFSTADFCLVHLLLSRHPGMLYQHFVECVFHFNSFEKHKGIAYTFIHFVLWNICSQSF